jgi:hypothetical protein
MAVSGRDGEGQWSAGRVADGRADVRAPVRVRVGEVPVSGRDGEGRWSAGPLAGWRVRRGDVREVAGGMPAWT